MKRYVAILLGLTAGALLAGCAANHAVRPVDHARLAAIHSAAGAPVGSFDVGVGAGVPIIYAWEPLSDHELLVYTRPGNAWLLDLVPCPLLLSTPYIGLTSHMNQVSANFGKVLVLRATYPCTIRQIRPVDTNQLKVAMMHNFGGKIVPQAPSGIRVER